MRHKYDGVSYRFYNVKWEYWTVLTLVWVPRYEMYAIHTKYFNDGLFGHVHPLHVRRFIKRHNLILA